MSTPHLSPLGFPAFRHRWVDQHADHPLPSLSPSVHVQQQALDRSHRGPQRVARKRLSPVLLGFHHHDIGSDSHLAPPSLIAVATSSTTSSMMVRPTAEFAMP